MTLLLYCPGLCCHSLTLLLYCPGLCCHSLTLLLYCPGLCCHSLTVIVLSRFMLLFMLVILSGIFEWKRICASVSFLSFFYIYILLLSRRKDLDPINRFNSATLLCLSKARTWISNVICRGLSSVQWVQSRWEVIVRFVDICWIDDHHCLNCS